MEKPPKFKTIELTWGDVRFVRETLKLALEELIDQKGDWESCARIENLIGSKFNIPENIRHL
jgi:hypothetical protein